MDTAGVMLECRAIRPGVSRTHAAETPDLIDRARSDPAAFGRLYRMHYADIAGSILRRVGDRHLAEDLAAETFLDAWRGLRRYRSRGIPFRHWLLRLATNRVHRWARTNRRRECNGVDLEGFGASPGTSEPATSVGEWEARASASPEIAEDRAELSHVLAALARLSTRHQAVLCLHHVEGLRVDQVARVLACSPGTVKSRLHRAREAMRRELERLEAES